MLQAFVDESAEKNNLFVMAGYIASSEQWLSFSDGWQRILDLKEHPHRPIDKFKMRRLTHGRGLRRAEMFYQVIETHVVAAFSCTIDTAGLSRSVRGFPWPSWISEPERLANPYYFAFKAITEGVAQFQEYFKLFEPVHFVFDEHSSKVPCLEGWDLIKQNSRSEVAKYLGDVPAFKNEEDALPLQAADLYAYWVRRWEVDGNKQGIQDLAFPWKAAVDIPRLAASFVEDDFTKEWEKSVAVHTLRRAGVPDAAILLSSKPKLNIR
jgi:hypothetical protein